MVQLPLSTHHQPWFRSKLRLLTARGRATSTCCSPSPQLPRTLCGGGPWEPLLVFLSSCVVYVLLLSVYFSVGCRSGAWKRQWVIEREGRGLLKCEGAEGEINDGVLYGWWIYTSLFFVIGQVANGHMKNYLVEKRFKKKKRKVHAACCALRINI